MRAIVYLEGEGAEKSLKLSELRRRALGILFHLQRIGAKPGDFLVLHVASNEQFIDAYWACLYGGIVPVPSPSASATSTSTSCCASRNSSAIRCCTRIANCASGWLRSQRQSPSRGVDGLEVAHVPGRPARRHFKSRAWPRTLTGTDRLHPVFVGLDQRTERRRAHAPQRPRERRRRTPGEPDSANRTSR